jgi:phosphoribosylformylglycinamidine cyclo-ligase
MYKVFNMGHRLEMYVDPSAADGIIEIAKSFQVDAKVIGRVEEGKGSSVSIRGEHGEFQYQG